MEVSAYCRGSARVDGEFSERWDPSIASVVDGSLAAAKAAILATWPCADGGISSHFSSRCKADFGAGSRLCVGVESSRDSLTTKSKSPFCATASRWFETRFIGAIWMVYPADEEVR